MTTTTRQRGMNRAAIPIYSTYTTYERALDELHQSGLPPTIDARSFSAIKIDAARRLVAGFRSIGWLDDRGVPSPELSALVRARNTDEWPQTLRAALRKSYSFVPDNWKELTSAKLAAVFRDYVGRDMAALKSAETFFLAAVQDAGIPLSPELAARAEKARDGLSANFRFRDSTSAPTNPAEEHQPASHANGAMNSGDVAQVWNLLALIDESDMTEKEKNAVLTLLAYLRRRAERSQRASR